VAVTVADVAGAHDRLARGNLERDELHGEPLLRREGQRREDRHVVHEELLSRRHYFCVEAPSCGDTRRA
jgi:hypothetical protein